MNNTTAAAAVELISFGYLHDAPPSGAVVVVDVRTHFYDPHRDPRTRNLTARDGLIRDKVLATPGVAALIDGLVTIAAAYAGTAAGAPVLIAVGCAGGRHRSPTIVGEAVARLQAAGIDARATHRDIELEVVDRPHTGAPA